MERPREKRRASSTERLTIAGLPGRLPPSLRLSGSTSPGREPKEPVEWLRRERRRGAEAAGEPTVAEAVARSAELDRLIRFGSRMSDGCSRFRTSPSTDCFACRNASLHGSPAGWSTMPTYAEVLLLSGGCKHADKRKFLRR